MSTLLKRLLRGIRGLSEREGEAKAEGAASLRKRIRSHVGAGALTEMQVLVLLRALDDAAPRP